jgi:hypothetical protein
MASNGSCFMVTWTILKNNLLEVGLTQNHRETMALWTLTMVDLFYVIMKEDPRKYNFVETTFSWGLGHIWLLTTLEGPWPHYTVLEVSWDGLWTRSFGLSLCHGHGSWLVCEVSICFNQISFPRGSQTRQNVQRKWIEIPNKSEMPPCYGQKDDGWQGTPSRYKSNPQN